MREECISSSSSSDDDDDEKGLGKEVCTLSDQYRRSEEEDLEHMVPRGLWSGGNKLESKIQILQHCNLMLKIKIVFSWC